MDNMKVIKNKKDEYFDILESLKYLQDHNSIELTNKIVEEYLRR